MALVFFTRLLCFLIPQIGSGTNVHELIPHNDEKFCFGRCGNWTHFPCACHERCLVYNNCCQDFNETCPVEYNLGMDRYGYLRDRRVTCSVEGVFVVNSCHRRDDHDFILGTTYSPMLNFFLDKITRKNLISTTLPSFVVNELQFDSKTDSGKVQQEVTLDLMLKHRPVFDTTSGILFSSYDTYRCNALPESQPIFWEIELGMETIQDIDSVIQNIESVISWKNVRYTLPKTLQDSRVGVHCIPQSINRCPEMIKYRNLTLYDLCKSYITYVNVKEGNILGSPRQYYQNAHCADCWGRKRSLSEQVFAYEPTDFDSPFSLLVSMSFNKDKVSIKQEEMNGALRRTAWKHISCDVEVGSKSSVNDCNDVACGDGAIRTTENRCVNGKFVRLALGAASFRLDPSKMNTLNSLIKCGFQNILGQYKVIEVGNDTQLATSVYFDQALNETLYQTTVVLDDTVDEDFVRKTDFLRNLDFFNKALNWYIKDWLNQDYDKQLRTENGYDYFREVGVSSLGFTFNHTNSDRNVSTHPANNSLVLVDQASQKESLAVRDNSTLPQNESLSTQTKLLKDAHPDLFRKNFQGRVVVNDTILYTTCTCEHTKGDTCQMLCWQTPLYLKDEYMMGEYKSSRCFHMLDGTSDGVVHIPTILVLLAHIMCFIMSFAR